MEEKADLSEVLSVASEAGHILLENGAEISRVEDIMSRISSYYGVDSGNFFVLSNGIFTTGSQSKVEKSGGQAATYANVEFIPLRGIQLSKVIEVNRLSYDIVAGRCTLAQAKKRLDQIRDRGPKPSWELGLGYAFGSGGFCAVFGGGFPECGAAAVVGVVLFLWVNYVSSRYLSKIVAGISNSLVATLCSIILFKAGFGHSLSNIIIGTLMPLVPGVPFVNGVRDLANSDYIAGLTRLTDAMIGFVSIAAGVSAAFLFDGWVSGGMISLGRMIASQDTYSLLVQALCAGVGTVSFAALFGVPRDLYKAAGVVGVLVWLCYLVVYRYAGLTPPVSTLVAAFLACIVSRYAAIPFKSPGNVFVICGIFTLVPGAGLFWSMYYLLSSEFDLALDAGFMAGKVAIAVVFGIILGMELSQWLFSRRKKSTKD
ncbi:MAG: threonine/serine exporter family protein [Bacteroidales bacterium]|nr:threonine/serine exporter family protein [Bacteroidales bacterium]